MNISKTTAININECSIEHIFCNGHCFFIHSIFLLLKQLCGFVDLSLSVCTIARMYPGNLLLLQQESKTFPDFTTRTAQNEQKTDG